MKTYIGKMKILFGAVKSYWLPYGVSTAIVSTRNYFINMLNAMLFSSIASAVQIQDLETLKKSAVLFLLFLLLFVLADASALYVQAITIHNMIVKVRQTLYSKFLRVPMKEVRASGANVGDILSRLNSDIDLVENIFSLNILYPLMLLISGIAGSISICRTNLVLWFYLVIVGAVAFLVKMYLSKKVYVYSNQRQMHFSKMLTMLNQLVANFPNIRLMNMTAPVTRWILKNVDRLGLTLNKQAVLNSNVSFVTTVVDIAVYAGVTVLGLIFMQTGEMHMEQILFVLPLAGMVTDMFLSLGDSLVNLKHNIVGIERVTEILVLPEEELGKVRETESCGVSEEKSGNVRESEACGTKEGILQEEISKEEKMEFRVENLSVVFENGHRIVYPKEFCILSHKMTAICGDSGCGKSTLGRLLVGLNTDYSGKIYYLGVPLENYSLESLRHSITYVPQKDYFIEGTILDNLLLGNERTISLEEVKWVAGMLGCDKWIWDLPGNYYGTISYGGASISGGQRQTLSIIRAVLRNSRTIILDESLSNMDANIIPVVIEGLKKLPQTVIIITHDRNIVECCENSLDLENGISCYSLSHEVK